jgi:hypothetical protein
MKNPNDLTGNQSRPQGHGAAGRIKSMKNPNDLMGNQSRPQGHGATGRIKSMKNPNDLMGNQIRPQGHGAAGRIKSCCSVRTVGQTDMMEVTVENCPPLGYYAQRVMLFPY